MWKCLFILGSVIVADAAETRILAEDSLPEVSEWSYRSVVVCYGEEGERCDAPIPSVGTFFLFADSGASLVWVDADSLMPRRFQIDHRTWSQHPLFDSLPVETVFLQGEHGAFQLILPMETSKVVILDDQENHKFYLFSARPPKRLTKID